MEQTNEHNPLANHLANVFDTVPIDRCTIPQGKLDLVDRTRTSVLPWKGQFSPELVDVLLATYIRETDVVLDPFVGSGTTLFECGRTGHRAFGFDVNPAAVFGARTAEMINLTMEQRQDLFAQAEQRLYDHLERFTVQGPFNSHKNEGRKLQGLEDTIRQFASEVAPRRGLETILVNVIMRAMGSDGAEIDAHLLFAAFHRYLTVCHQLPYSKQPLKARQGDAAFLPLADETIDAVITSPPYINVFNYHQFYRKSMELIGIQPLTISDSEIGANRKHRRNRFLTVIQYCIDMLEILRELGRVLKAGGRIIIVVGRESTVLGQRFENARAIYCLACGGAGFDLVTLHERVFVNRYGQDIYEHILVLTKNASRGRCGHVFARSVAEWMLRHALESASDKASPDLQNALEEIEIVQPSPRLTQTARAIESTADSSTSILLGDRDEVSA